MVNGGLLRRIGSMVDYSGWSRESLIEKLQALESKLHNEAPNVATVAAEANSAAVSAKPSKTGTKKQRKPFDFSKFQTRPIALKFAYLGWNYQGLALQAVETEKPTVEHEILKALATVKLIASPDIACCNFSRCGRTDRGVSAMNQVISLTVRSKLTEEELKDPENDSRELDYIRMLNHILPGDIRFHAVCLRPPKDFDARFSCIYRHYKYIFNGAGLDIGLMAQAAKYYEGEHDFRNFCKVDASKQIVNFKRSVYQAYIEPKEDEPGFYALNLRGSAFLWHQVRCMMAVLFLVGQKFEKPEIIPELMDIDKYPGRPTYNMAHDIPLVLYDCGFEDDVVWGPGPYRTMLSHAPLNSLQNDNKIKSIVTEYMDDLVKKDLPEKMEGKIVVDLGDGVGQVATAYTSLEKRKKMATPEDINKRWLDKKKAAGHVIKRQRLD